MAWLGVVVLFPALWVVKEGGVSDHAVPAYALGFSLVTTAWVYVTFLLIGGRQN